MTERRRFRRFVGPIVLAGLLIGLIWWLWPRQATQPPEPPPAPVTTVVPTAPTAVDATPAPGVSPSSGADSTPVGAAPDETVPSPTAEPTAAPRRVRVVGTGGQGANVRQEPGSGGRVVRAVRDGTELTVVGEPREVDGRTWLNVRDATGATGWIAAELVEPIAPAASPGPEPPPTNTPADTPTPAPTVPPTPPAEPFSPCRSGQIKGDASSGLYFLPSHPDYGTIRDRVRCFDSESQARASGFLPAPGAADDPAGTPEPD